MPVREPYCTPSARWDGRAFGLDPHALMLSEGGCELTGNHLHAIEQTRRFG